MSSSFVLLANVGSVATWRWYFRAPSTELQLKVGGRENVTSLSGPRRVGAIVCFLKSA
jgi:hypothetical protein